MRALALAALLLAVTAATAAAELDPSFGGSGWIRIAEAPGDITVERATDVAVQPDGKVVVTAEAREGTGDPGWLVLRFLPSGAPDPGFGQGGTAVLGTYGTPEALALQPDGRIVVTGTSLCPGLQKCFAVTRLNPDGSADPTFGAGGTARHPQPRPSEAHDLAVGAGGRIVAAGTVFKPNGDANDDDLGLIVQLLPDGRLDASFGGDGVVRIDHGHGDDVVEAVAFQGRRIVVAGQGRVISGSRGGFGVARFRADGARDRSFGRRGRRIVAIGRGWAVARALAVAPGGRLLLAGAAGRGVTGRPALVRLTRDGRLDRGFGRDGRVRLGGAPFGGVAEAVAVGPHAEVVSAGEAFLGPWPDGSAWQVARLTPRGTLAAGGVEHSDLSVTADGATAAALADGRLVGAGTISDAAGVARFVLR